MHVLQTKLYDLKPHKLDRVQEILSLDLLSESVWLAGGALRTLIDSEDEVNDFDIFFKSVEAQINIKNKLTSAGFEIIYECPNGFLFTYKKNSVKVQLVCRQYYSSPEELISSFDFTVTCAATNGKFLYYTRPFIKDIKRKELHLSNLTYPVASFKRAVRYSNKGYSVREFAEEFVKTVNTSGPLSDEGMISYID
jgi:hypothetical protein